MNYTSEDLADTIMRAAYALPDVDRTIGSFRIRLNRLGSRYRLRVSNGYVLTDVESSDPREMLGWFSDACDFAQPRVPSAAEISTNDAETLARHYPEWGEA